MRPVRFVDFLVIQFERSTNYELIRQIITHERIWGYLSDDGSPPREDFEPLESNFVWYVIACDVDDAGGGEILGLWMFFPHNTVCWEVHTCLLPIAWGERGQAAAKMLPDWIWRNTPCRRIVTNVPTYNRLALHFAFKAGMKMYGVNPDSYLKDGILRDQMCLGISKPDCAATSEVEKGDTCQSQP